MYPPASDPAPGSVSPKPPRTFPLAKGGTYLSHWASLPNCRMGEVPSHEHARKFGESKIKLRKVAFRYVYTLFKYLFF